jgi:hypothetical protein
VLVACVVILTSIASPGAPPVKAASAKPAAVVIQAVGEEVVWTGTISLVEAEQGNGPLVRSDRQWEHTLTFREDRSAAYVLSREDTGTTWDYAGCSASSAIKVDDAIGTVAGMYLSASPQNADTYLVNIHNYALPTKEGEIEETFTCDGKTTTITSTRDISFQLGHPVNQFAAQVESSDPLVLRGTQSFDYSTSDSDTGITITNFLTISYNLRGQPTGTPLPPGPCAVGVVKDLTLPLTRVKGTITTQKFPLVGRVSQIEETLDFSVGGKACPDALVLLAPGTASPLILRTPNNMQLSIGNDAKITTALPITKNVSIGPYLAALEGPAVLQFGVEGSGTFASQNFAEHHFEVKEEVKLKLGLNIYNRALAIVAVTAVVAVAATTSIEGVLAFLVVQIARALPALGRLIGGPLLPAEAPPTLAALAASAAPVTPELRADLATVFGAALVNTATIEGLTTDGDQKGPGQIVSYRGTGFVPNGVVQGSLVLPGVPDAAVAIETRADAQGIVVGQVTLPADAPTGRWLLSMFDIQALYGQLEDLAAGRITALHPRILAANIAVGSAAPAPSFADVPADYWAYGQIGQFAARGITTGCGDDENGQRLYCPERGVTRAEMATFITRTLGQDKVAPPVAPTFADVPADYWAYGQIEAFLDLGITTGCGEDEAGNRLFCPDRGVTRAEMAAFIDRAKGQGLLDPGTPTFADVPADYWAYGWIERFFTLGVTTGCGTDEHGRKVYCPDRGVTRAEMAVFIIRAYP